MVYESLSGAAAYETEFWMMSSTGGIPEKLESTLTISRSPMTTTPADAICSFFNSSWWDDKAVARLEEMYERGGGGWRGDLEIMDRLALMKPDAEKLLRHIHDHLGTPAKQPDQSHGYLDPSHPRYAPKLAAAVRAWQAVTDAGKTTPKQALDKWLRANAAEFGMINDVGKPVEAAVVECSTVANWNFIGGAPKTPSA